MSDYPSASSHSFSTSLVSVSRTPVAMIHLTESSLLAYVIQRPEMKKRSGKKQMDSRSAKKSATSAAEESGNVFFLNFCNKIALNFAGKRRIVGVDITSRQ